MPLPLPPPDPTSTPLFCCFQCQKKTDLSRDRCVCLSGWLAGWLAAWLCIWLWWRTRVRSVVLPSTTSTPTCRARTAPSTHRSARARGAGAPAEQALDRARTRPSRLTRLLEYPSRSSTTRAASGYAARSARATHAPMNPQPPLSSTERGTNGAAASTTVAAGACVSPGSPAHPQQPHDAAVFLRGGRAGGESVTKTRSAAASTWPCGRRWGAAGLVRAGWCLPVATAAAARQAIAGSALGHSFVPSAAPELPSGTPSMRMVCRRAILPAPASCPDAPGRQAASLQARSSQLPGAAVLSILPFCTAPPIAAGR
jgi:hypothetical protein